MKRPLLSLTLLVCLFHANISVAAGYAVVVSTNTPVTIMEARNIRDVFLRKRNFESEVRMFPVNILGDEMVRRTFEQLILKMNRDQLNRYWVESHFQGVSPPATQASLTSVKRFVERVDGAIGYLPVGMVDERLRVIYEF